MSKENVRKLFEKLQKDSDLQNKYAALMKAHSAEAEKALAERLIELGKSAGFEFSTADLLAARAELMDKKNSNNELADSDLESVAGGERLTKGGAIAVSLFGMGIGCAILSAAAESFGPGECRGALTIEKC